MHRARRRPLAALGALLAIVTVAGCGSYPATRKAAPTTSTTPAATMTSSVSTRTPGGRPPAATADVRVYFLHHDVIGVAHRSVPVTGRIAGAAMSELLAGLTPADRAAGLTSAVPAGSHLLGLAVSDGTATVELSAIFASAPDAPSVQGRVAQVVYTLTQLPTVARVAFELDGRPAEGIGGVTVAQPVATTTFPAVAPPALVELPGRGWAARSPIHLSGTAAVFEGQFWAGLTTGPGQVVALQPMYAPLVTSIGGPFDAEMAYPPPPLARRPRPSTTAPRRTALASTSSPSRSARPLSHVGRPALPHRAPAGAARGPPSGDDLRDNALDLVAPASRAGSREGRRRMARTEELQRATAAQYWDRFEAVMGGPDGLMTYRYLGTRADLDSGGRRGGMNIRRDMRYPAGGLMAAPLSIALADAAGVHGDAVAIPAPVTSSVHVVDDGADVRAICVLGEDTPGHAGRQLRFGGTSLVVDANDPERVLAVTESLGVDVGQIPETARGGYRYVDPGPGVPDAPELPALHEAFGAVPRGDDLELPVLSQRIGSTSGSLHHGPIQVVLEAAAFHLASRQAGTDRLQIEDWTVAYMARGKIGPFVTSGTALSGNLGRLLARVQLRDEGNGDRLVATALAVYRRVA